MRSILVAASQLPPGAPPGRYWLERLAWIVPGATATRWLLLAGAVVIVLIAASARRPFVAASTALGAALVALNVAGMVLTDFFLGLAAFHVLSAGAGIVAGGRARQAGLVLVGLVVALGVLT